MKNHLIFVSAQKCVFYPCVIEISVLYPQNLSLSLTIHKPHSQFAKPFEIFKAQFMGMVTLFIRWVERYSYVGSMVTGVYPLLDEKTSFNAIKNEQGRHATKDVLPSQ